MRWFIPILFVLGLIAWFYPKPPSTEERKEEPIIKEEAPLLFDHLLETRPSPQEEIRAMQDLVTQFSLYHKAINTVFYDTNPGLTEQLLKHRELSPKHPSLGIRDGEKVILDRWGEPYIFHFEGSKKIQLRSPGPDRQSYTDDDLVWPKK